MKVPAPLYVFVFCFVVIQQALACSAASIPTREYPAYACFDDGLTVMDSEFQARVHKKLESFKQLEYSFSPCSSGFSGTLRALHSWSDEERERYFQILDFYLPNEK